jgi:predicted alpha/beta superfamily hydrolase
VTGIAKPLTPLGDVDVHDLWSEAVQDTYRIFIARCGEQPATTVFVTDANGLFGTAVDTIRMMQLPALLPDLLVVGIGYPTAATIADTISIRVRDLTPTSAYDVQGSGGAPAFVRFIRDELRPWLGPRFPSALQRTIYFGHSLGGLFGVQALFAEPSVFDAYIISSPSLWWDRYVAVAQEEDWAASHDDLAAQTYFGIGAGETDEGRRIEATNLPDGHSFKPPETYLDMVDDLERFTTALRQRGYPNLALAAEVFPDEFHATVPGIVLSHGLRHFLGPA